MVCLKESELDLFYKNSTVLISGGNGVRNNRDRKDLQIIHIKKSFIVYGKSFGGNFAQMFQR